MTWLQVVRDILVGVFIAACALGIGVVAGEILWRARHR